MYVIVSMYVHMYIRRTGRAGHSPRVLSREHLESCPRVQNSEKYLSCREVFFGGLFPVQSLFASTHVWVTVS